MKDCSSDFLIIYSQSMPSHSHPAFGSAWMLEGHRANASVFSLESAQGISAGWKHSHRYASEAARGLMSMRVWVWLSFTAPRSSLLPSTGTLFLPSFPFLSLPSLIWHCLTIRYTRACMLPMLFFFFPCTCASENLPVADLWAMHGLYVCVMLSKINKPCVRFVPRQRQGENKRRKEWGS